MGKKGVTFLRGGCNFYIKNKLKSDILNEKKGCKQKNFSAITKNSNWEILTKNFVTFKRLDGVNDKNPIFRGRGS